MDIDYKASPNHSSRDGAKIEMIVMHATVGSYKSVLAWLRSPASKASTHYLIRKDGAITQLVADDRAAWHAGAARWQGRTDLNERSIGVELENANTGHDPYPPAQLAAARDLCRAKAAQYGITRAGVVRHLDVAIPKGRKSDPAGLDWPVFVASVFALPEAPTLPPPVWNAAQYRVVAIQISQRQSGGPPYAGALPPGALVEIDMIYANNMCHLKNERGFVPISALIPAGDVADADLV